MSITDFSEYERAFMGENGSDELFITSLLSEIKNKIILPIKNDLMPDPNDVSLINKKINNYLSNDSDIT